MGRHSPCVKLNYLYIELGDFRLPKCYDNDAEYVNEMATSLPPKYRTNQSNNDRSESEGVKQRSIG